MAAWAEVTSESTLTGDKQVVTRTDQLTIPSGLLYRTVVMVRRGVEVIAVSVATTFVPPPPVPGNY